MWTNKSWTYWRDLLCFFLLLGTPAAAIVYATVTYRAVPERTCEDAKLEAWAFEQCMNIYPACQIEDTPASRSRYQEIKKWAAENCPSSGDDYQSQSSE